LIHNKI